MNSKIVCNGLLGRNQMKVVGAALLIIGLLVSMINIPVFAAEQVQQEGLFDILYSNSKENPAKRNEILKVLTGKEEPVQPFQLQSITDANASEVAKKILEQLGAASVIENDMIAAIQQFYTYQQNNSDMAAEILKKYKEGLRISKDLNDAPRNFDAIEMEITNKYNSFLVFLNIMLDAKDYYNDPREVKIYNYLYVDDKGMIQLYDDISMMLSNGIYKSHIEALKEILMKANSNSTEDRDAFVNYLKHYLLIDLNKRSNDGYVPKEIEDQFKYSPTVTFNDLSTVPWAKEYIEKLSSAGILKGVGEGTFAPDNNVTREEFAKMLVSAFGFSDDTAKTQLTDVSLDAWYYPYVSVAEKFEIVKGNGTSFGVGQNITRQDMAVMAYRAARKANVEIKSTNAQQLFADDDAIAEYAKESVGLMQQAGIINGMEGNRFAPEENATRAQAAKIIYLLIQ